ncbi:phosphatidylinositol alpha-mannosyltransferase, partial [Vibrio parahaemolyticus]
FKDQQNLESNAISQDEMVKYYESSL